jgi:hypothetical protein
MSQKTRVGRFVKVANRNRKHNANEYYYSSWIMVNGIMTPVLFTEDQINSGIYRAKLNPEDIAERSLTSKILD